MTPTPNPDSHMGAAPAFVFGVTVAVTPVPPSTAAAIPAATDAHIAVSTAAPLAERQRIQFLDALRGMAVFGILIMNIMAMGQSFHFYIAMDTRQSMRGLNFWAWVVEVGLFEGTMRGLFSLLFGAGTILLLERLEASRNGLIAADIYYRRILLLIGLGVINAFVLLWPGDILYHYGLVGLALFPFRKCSPRQLLIPIILLTLFGLYRESVDLADKRNTINKGRLAESLKAKHQLLSEEQAADLEKWQGYQTEHNAEGLAKAVKKEETALQSRNLFKITNFIYGWNVLIERVAFWEEWDIAIFFFMGMALFKMGFFGGWLRKRTYAVLAIVGITVGLGINGYDMWHLYVYKFDGILLTEKSPWLATYQLRRIFQVMGYLSVLVLLYKMAPFRRVFNVLAPVGQMALTNYLAQSLITAILFFGFGVFGRLQRYQLLEVAAGIWIFETVFSHWWLRYFNFGPVEWVWRSLTYGKKPLMKRGVG